MEVQISSISKSNMWAFKVSLGPHFAVAKWYLIYILSCKLGGMTWRIRDPLKVKVLAPDQINIIEDECRWMQMNGYECRLMNTNSNLQRWIKINADVVLVFSEIG